LMRVRVAVLGFAVVSMLAAGCGPGEAKQPKVPTTGGKDYGQPALAKKVCDEFCDPLDAAADKVTSCKPNACEPQMTAAQDLMKAALEKLGDPDDTDLVLAHNSLVVGLDGPHEYLDTTLRPTGPSDIADLISITADHMTSAADSMRIAAG
jgi:hypothetical protein